MWNTINKNALRTAQWWLAICLIGLVGFGSRILAQHDDREGAPVTVTGELKIVQIDDAAGRGQLLYLLEEKETRKTFKLRLSDQNARHLRSGMVVTARSKAKGQELLLAADG